MCCMCVCVCRHFDKDKSGRLDHQEFKSCLRALGYDLPMVEEGQRDPEFESILEIVDPNRWAKQHFIWHNIWLSGFTKSSSSGE